MQKKQGPKLMGGEDEDEQERRATCPEAEMEKSKPACREEKKWTNRHNQADKETKVDAGGQTTSALCNVCAMCSGFSLRSGRQVSG